MKILPWSSKSTGKRALIAFFATFLVSMALFGCSVDEKTAADLPQPGEMRVISVEPLSQGPSGLDNLVPNGNFTEWWAGAPGPTHFVLPPAQFSTLERLVAGEGQYPCAQTWKKTDRKIGKDKRLHVFVPNIKPDTEYEFSVQAQSVDGCTALIDVYECTPERTEFGMACYGQPVIPPDATSPTWFKARFKTKKGGNLAIYPGTVDEKVPPGKIIWYAWHIREVSGGAPSTSVSAETPAASAAPAEAPVPQEAPSS